jgi:hypothetical protein
MERGGVEGRIRALAALRVAEGAGVGVDDLVDEFRNDRHRRYLREGEMLSVARASIPSGRDLTSNPYADRPGPSAIETYSGRNRAIPGASEARELFKKGNKRKRPLWN